MMKKETYIANGQRFHTYEDVIKYAEKNLLRVSNTETTRQVAKLLRWQAQNLNGSWDMGEVNNIAKIAQRKFLIIE